jgi:hypothetical protein
MTRGRVILLALLAAAAAGIAVSLPPRPLALDTEALVDAPVVRGAYHVHSNRSDGTGSVRQIALAAGRAGLSFVILTDHGDGRRQADPPEYVDGVLVIDGVEISTTRGHVVALGMKPAPYPLDGEPHAVVEDVTRLGGVAIVAHPGSPKEALRWSDWSVPFHGLEWLNGDSEWRDEGVASLAKTLFTYTFRRPETLATLLDRPDDVLRQWDALLAKRPVVALAGGDAHGGLSHEADRRLSVRVPGYEQVFRSMSIAIPRLALAGDAAIDAELIITAIMEGNVYSAIDAIARPAAFGFVGTTGGVRAGLGGRLPVGAPVELSVTSNAPGDARIVLLKDGAPAAESRGATLSHTAPAGPGVYRVEVHVPGAPGEPPVPWLLSNPIYVRPQEQAMPAVGAPTAKAVQYADGPADLTVEHSSRAQGAFDVVPTVSGTELSLRYALAGTLEEGPFVALTMPAGAVAGYDRLTFTARASKPMRVSVELRLPLSTLEGERWHRSVYLDETPRVITVFFDEMTPRGRTTQKRPDLSIAQTVLFVVDSLNTPPGSSGQIWIDDVAYER